MWTNNIIVPSNEGANPQIWAKATAPPSLGVSNIAIRSIYRNAYADGGVMRDPTLSVAFGNMARPTGGNYVSGTTVVTPPGSWPVLEMSWFYPNGWGAGSAIPIGGVNNWYQFRIEIRCSYTDGSYLDVWLNIHIREGGSPPDPNQIREPWLFGSAEDVYRPRYSDTR
jgi:hypothetical protein